VCNAQPKKSDTTYKKYAPKNNIPVACVSPPLHLHWQLQVMLSALRPPIGNRRDTRSHMLHGAQGASKKQIGDPRGGWVGGSEAKIGPGSDFPTIFFYCVFELPSPRNAQKRDKQNREKSVLDFLSIFL
jgi:hypothetical protein